MFLFQTVESTKFVKIFGHSQCYCNKVLLDIVFAWPQIMQSLRKWHFFSTAGLPDIHFAVSSSRYLCLENLLDSSCPASFFKSSNRLNSSSISHSCHSKALPQCLDRGWRNVWKTFSKICMHFQALIVPATYISIFDFIIVFFFLLRFQYSHRFFHFETSIKGSCLWVSDNF